MKNKINNNSSIYNDFPRIRKITSVTFLFARIYFMALFIAIAVSACNNKTDTNVGSNPSYPDSLELFKQLDSSVTGINFHNDIKEDEHINAIVYEYTCNGGGVAIGDVNNDSTFFPNMKVDIRWYQALPRKCCHIFLETHLYIRRVYPGANVKFVLYEDENDNYNYEKGIYSTISFDWDDKKKTLMISDRNGSFPGMLDSGKFNIVIVNTNKGGGENIAAQPDKEITYSGKKMIVKF